MSEDWSVEIDAETERPTDLFDSWLTAGQAAEIMHRSNVHVTYLCRTKWEQEGRAKKIGDWRIDPSAVEKYVADYKARPPGPPRIYQAMLDRARLGELSPRDRKIVGLYLDGVSYRRIGDKLGIGQRTARRAVASAVRTLANGS